MSHLNQCTICYFSQSIEMTRKFRGHLTKYVVGSKDLTQLSDSYFRNCYFALRGKRFETEW